MESLEIAVSPRQATGKGGARQERRDGRIPGILYSKSENLALSVDRAEFARLLRRVSAGNALLDVKVEGKSGGMKALIKEVQRDPVSDQPVHFDLVHIEMDQKVKVRVPLHYQGTPVGVKLGGRVEESLREVDLECVASDIPAYLEIDISGLQSGDSIHVRDLERPGIRFLTSPDLVAIAVVAKKGEAEEAEGAAPAAAAPAEGEAAEGGSEA